MSTTTKALIAVSLVITAALLGTAWYGIHTASKVQATVEKIHKIDVDRATEKARKAIRILKDEIAH